MGKAAQTGLDTANENGHILISLTDQIAVDDGGVVGPLTHDTAGGKGIGLAFVLGHGVVIDHGVHIAAGNQETQTGSAQNIDGLGIAPIRLGDDAHSIAGVFQYTADDGMSEGGVVHIGIGNDVYKVALA